MKFIEYNKMTEKQKEAYKKYIIGDAKFGLESYYDSFYEEWDSPKYEKLYKEFLNLLNSKDYEKLYYFIIEYELYS